MKWSGVLSLISAAVLLVEPVLPGAAQIAPGTANSPASAVALGQHGPVELPVAAEPRSPGALLTESVDCSGVLSSQIKLYLPLILRGGTTGALAAAAVQPAALEPFGPATSVGADFASASAFLYQGSAAVQHDLQPQGAHQH